MFIGGGIGITPMRAMFWDCIRRRIPVCLLYAVREVQEAAFLEELQKVLAPFSPAYLPCKQPLAAFIRLGFVCLMLTKFKVYLARGGGGGQQWSCTARQTH